MEVLVSKNMLTHRSLRIPNHYYTRKVIHLQPFCAAKLWTHYRRCFSDTICSLDRRLLLVAASLHRKACEFAQRFATEFHDRIQVDTYLLVEPARDSCVPPAVGLQEHKLHGCSLGVVLEQGASEAQTRSERGRAVLRKHIRMQGSGKLVHSAYHLDGLLAMSRLDERLTFKEH